MLSNLTSHKPYLAIQAHAPLTKLPEILPSIEAEDPFPG